MSFQNDANLWSQIPGFIGKYHLIMLRKLAYVPKIELAQGSECVCMTLLPSPNSAPIHAPA